jgi:hypothetical protein
MMKKNTNLKQKSTQCAFTLGKTLDHGSYQNQAQAQLLPCMGPYSNKKSKAPWPWALYLAYILTAIGTHPHRRWVLLVLAKKTIG